MASSEDGGIFESEGTREPATETNVAAHEHELTEDELSDLTFAFQACDLDDAVRLPQTSCTPCSPCSVRK